MSEQELEEQVEGSEVDETQTDDTGEPTETPDKATKNKSNFKKLSEAKKNLEKRLSEAEEEINAWRSENPDLIKETLSKKESKGVDKSELALFIAKNPEARDNLDAIKEFAEDFNIKLDTEEALEKAWKRVKPTIPQESKTQIDFNIKSKGNSQKLDLSKLTLEEAYSEGVLTPEQRKEWRKIHYPE